MRGKVITIILGDSNGRRNTGFFTHASNSSSASAGVFQPSVFLGLALRAAATADISSASVDAQICALREVLPQQPVGVLVRAALPGASWIAEVDLDSRIDLETTVLSHFGSLIPGQRTTQFFGQGDDGARDRIAHSFSSVSRERRPVLGTWTFAMPLQAGEDAGAS